jgi:PEGA domain-containing protein
MSGDEIPMANFDVTLHDLIDAIGDRFKRAWVAGERPSLEGYLEGHVERIRTELFQELLAIELEYLSKSETAWDLAQYQQRFPNDTALIHEVVTALAQTKRRPTGGDSKGRPSQSQSQLLVELESLMAKQPEDRFVSADELAQALAPLVKILRTRTRESADRPRSHERGYENPVAEPEKTVLVGKDHRASHAAGEDATVLESSQSNPVIAAKAWQKRLLIAPLSCTAVFGLITLAILLQVKTPIGTIVVEVDQPEIKGAVVSVDGQQKITITPSDKQEPIEVTADEKEHTLKVVKEGFETLTEKFIIKAGQSQTIRVRLERTAPGPNPPLQELSAIPRLRRFGLHGRGFGPAAWEHAGKLTRLELLDLIDTNINDEGLAQLTELTNLVSLRLDRTDVTDQGLMQLRNLPKLREVGCSDSPSVTPAGVQALLNALPSLRGNVELPDRRAAEMVIHFDDPRRQTLDKLLALGGALHVVVGDETRHVPAKTQLPADAFRIASVYLNGIQSLTVANCKLLNEFGEIRVLDLTDSPLSDDCFQVITELGQVRGIRFQ